MGTAFAAFYLPVTIICIVYYKIWMKTKKRQIELRSLQAEQSSKVVDFIPVKTEDEPTKGYMKSKQFSSSQINKNESNLDQLKSKFIETNNIKVNSKCVKERENVHTTNDDNQQGVATIKTYSETKYENGSRIKKFFKHLVDKEEEEEIEPTNNDVSTTVSCEATTFPPSSIANETEIVALNKCSLDTAIGIDMRRQSTENSRKILHAISRICHGKKSRAFPTSKSSIDYSKCKLVYKSSRHVSQSIGHNKLSNVYDYSEHRMGPSSSRSSRYSIFKLFLRFNKNKGGFSSGSSSVKDIFSRQTPKIKLCKFSEDDISFTKEEENEYRFNQKTASPVQPKITKDYPPFSLENNQIYRLIEYKKCSCNICVMRELSFSQFDHEDFVQDYEGHCKKKNSFERDSLKSKIISNNQNNILYFTSFYFYVND